MGGTIDEYPRSNVVKNECDEYFIWIPLGSTLFKDDMSVRGVRERGSTLFRPRLGKRTLRLNNESDRQVFLRLLEAADALKYYYGQKPYYESQADDPELKVTKKVIFTPKLGRSVDGQPLYENVDFTPRLGRRLATEGVTPADQDVYRSDSDQMDRSKYFSPRLGRNQHFSPRLGRDLIYDYPEKVRVVRSANNSIST